MTKITDRGIITRDPEGKIIPVRNISGMGVELQRTGADQAVDFTQPGYAMVMPDSATNAGKISVNHFVEDMVKQKTRYG